MSDGNLEVGFMIPIIARRVSAVQDVLIWTFYHFTVVAWVKLIGAMRNGPEARWQVKPNLMMVFKCVFTPTLHTY